MSLLDVPRPTLEASFGVIAAHFLSGLGLSNGPIHAVGCKDPVQIVEISIRELEKEQSIGSEMRGEEHKRQACVEKITKQLSLSTFMTLQMTSTCILIFR